MSKFNTFLLERYPLLFHSKFPHLMGLAILLWIFSYGMGYLLFNHEALLEDSVTSFYFESTFILIHLAILLIFISLWLIHFYRHNPLKHFYPLQKSYFSRLFMLIFIPFLLLSMAKIPFDAGVKASTKQMVDYEEFKKERQDLNLVFPFFIQDIDLYNIGKKAYPKPFPLKMTELSMDGDIIEEVETYNKTLSKHSSHTVIRHNLSGSYYNPLHTKGPYFEVQNFNFNLLDYEINSKSPYLVGDNYYIFYDSETMYHSADSCNSTEVIKKWYDKNDGFELDKMSLSNFSTEWLSQHPSRDSYLYSYGRYSDESLPDSSLKTIHEIIKSRSAQQLVEQLNTLQTILKKYGIDHRLNSEDISTYLIHKNYKDFAFTVVHSNDQDLRREYIGAKSVIVARNYNDYDYYDYSKEDKEIIEHNFYVKNSQIQRLNKAVNASQVSVFEFEEFLVMLFISFFMTMLIVWFEFTEIRSFLLSLPTAGVIALLFGLYTYILSEISFSLKDFIPFSLFLLFSFIICFTIFAVKSNKIPRIIASIGINLTYLLSSFSVFLFLIWINDLLKTDVYDKCDHYSRRVGPLEGIIDNPISFLILAFIGVFSFFLLVPHWKAKKKKA